MRILPYRAYATSDGDLVVAAGNDGLFRKLCGVLGHPQWAQDPRFLGNPERVQNAAPLDSMIKAEMAQRSSADWIAALDQAGVPCAPVQTIDQVFQAPQVLHRDMLMEIDHPTAGKVRMAGIPVKFSVTPASVRKPPPLLGEHNEEVLKNWLGMSADAIDELKREKII